MNVKDSIWFCKCLCDMGAPEKLVRLRELGFQISVYTEPLAAKPIFL